MLLINVIKAFQFESIALLSLLLSEATAPNNSIWQKIVETVFNTPVSFLISAGLSYLIAKITTRHTFDIETQLKANIGIYQQIYRCMSDLETINKNCSTEANPFCLLYKPEIITAHSKLQIPFGSYAQCLEKYTPIANDIFQTLAQGENNIAPRGVRNSVWRRKQKSIIAFAEMIINKDKVKSVDIFTSTHRVKWNDLQDAVSFLKKATEFTQK